MKLNSEKPVLYAVGFTRESVAMVDNAKGRQIADGERTYRAMQPRAEAKFDSGRTIYSPALLSASQSAPSCLNVNSSVAETITRTFRNTSNGADLWILIRSYTGLTTFVGPIRLLLEDLIGRAGLKIKVYFWTRKKGDLRAALSIARLEAHPSRRMSRRLISLSLSIYIYVEARAETTDFTFTPEQYAKFDEWVKTVFTVFHATVTALLSPAGPGAMCNCRTGHPVHLCHSSEWCNIIAAASLGQWTQGCPRDTAVSDTTMKQLELERHQYGTPPHDPLSVLPHPVVLHRWARRGVCLCLDILLQPQVHPVNRKRTRGGSWKQVLHMATRLRPENEDKTLPS
jgi:hypothetical protein